MQTDRKAVFAAYSVAILQIVVNQARTLTISVQPGMTPTATT